MKSIVLVGNGINIQFGGVEYTNRNIIDRAIKNIEEGNFPEDIYPYEIKEYFERLYAFSSKIIRGKIQIHVGKREEAELRNFIQRYRFHKGKLRYYQIGFEDYFMLHEFFCRYNHITNPEKFNFQEALKCFFLDSIYNNGDINKLFNLYPKGLINWFSQFDEIFTTNYDKNIELLTNMEVYYLHGGFHIRKDIYDENSFRNKLSDSPIRDYKIIEGYDHLYSNALSTYSGSLKEFSGAMNDSANKAITKFVQAIDEDPKRINEIAHFRESDNQLLRNMYESIILKLKDKSLQFNDYYPFDKLKDNSGVLTIIGLSPNNDSHILDMILNNKEIIKIVYYFYEESEGQTIVNYFPEKEVELKNVNDFWDKFCQQN